MRPTRFLSGALLLLALVALQACDETGTTPGEGETYTLTVTLDGLGIGSVTNDESGIACDTTGATCSGDLPEGTSVTLTATAAPGSEFVGWGDAGTANPLTVTMDADKNITAEFDNPDLAMESVGASGGELTSRDSAVVLDIPAGALSTATEITIKRVDPSDLGDAWSDLVGAGDIQAAYEMGPDGQAFDTPITVTLAPGTLATSGDTTALAVRPLATSAADSVQELDSLMVAGDLTDGTTTTTARLSHFSPLVETVGDVTFKVSGIPEGPVPVGTGFTAVVDVEFPEGWDPETVDVLQGSDGPYYMDGIDRAGEPHRFAFAYECSDIGTEGIIALYVTVRDQWTGKERTLEFTARVDCSGYYLTVTTSGEGSGTVTSTPEGIVCGSGGDVCQIPLPPGAEVSLTATPDEGSGFDGWTGDGTDDQTAEGVQRTLTMDGDRSVDASFGVAPEEELSVSMGGAGDGTVTSDPAGIDCTKEGETVTGDCAANFPAGSTVQLTATTPDGSTVTDWSGDGTTDPFGIRHVEMLTTMLVEIFFPQVPPTVTTLDLGAHGLWYIEALSLVNLAFPFVQPTSDLAWETAGEACPTVLVAADARVGAINACDGSLVQSYSSTATLYDAYALPRPEGETGDHAIFATGNDYQFFWVDDSGQVTDQVRQTGWGTVPDATAIEGDPRNGLAMIRDDGFGQTVRFVRYDPAKGYHDLLTDYVGVTTTPPNAQSVFAAGVPTDPQALPEEMLVVGNTSNDGVLYYIETTSEEYPTWQQVTGTLSGDNPRRLRCDLDSGICAVSDFANSLVTVILWSGTGMPTIGSSTTAGQIASGPVGLDVYGSYIVTAGYNDDSYSIIEVDGSGNVVNATTTALPAECSAPGHATFLRDAANTVLVSCNASQAIVRIPNAF